MASSFSKIYASDDYLDSGRGDVVKKIYTFSLGAYATGGESVALATNMSLPGTIYNVKVEDNGGGNTYEFHYDYANDKLKVFTAASAAEVANATDLSGTTVRCEVLCQAYT